MRRNCNYASIALGLLLGALYLYQAWGSFITTAHADVPTAAPSAAQTKRLVREFVRAQENELLLLRRKNNADLKALRTSQSAAFKEWDAHERDARHKYFADHKGGPERRTYIQDYKKREDDYILNQKTEESARKRAHDSSLESLRLQHIEKLKEFHNYLNRGEHPPAELWPAQTNGGVSQK